MIEAGSVVRFVGNDIAGQRAREHGVVEWGPDSITTGSLGICEYFVGLSIQAYRLYRCRFSDKENPTQHKTGNFFFFEIEEV